MLYLVDRTDGLLKVFSADGRLVRSVGRRGGGPGEYESVRNVLVSPDGVIHLLDGVLGRWTVFGRDGDVVRTTRIPVGPALAEPAVLRSDGQLVVNVGSTLASAHETGTLHLVDAQGDIKYSFDTAVVDPRAPWRRWRLLWSRPDGGLLVAQPYSSTIDVYDSDLTRKGSVVRVGEPFPLRQPEGSPSDGVFDRPFTPMMSAMWEDASGLRWLEVRVPSPLWTPRRRVHGLGGQAYSNLGNRPRFDTILEVLDVRRRSVLARSRLNGPIGVPFGGGYFAVPAEDSSGEPRAHIIRAKLTT
jgi:hypothetical protein